MSAIELYGYVAMAVVIISCMSKDVLKLRIGNLVGCVMFIAYGIMIGAKPVVIMNVIITLIHVYSIWKIWKSK